MQKLNLKSTIARRWKLFLVIALGLMAVRFVVWRPVARLFRTEMRFIVGTQPLDSTLETEEEKYYLWIASEYVVASVSDYANGGDFVQMVSDILIAQGYEDLDFDATDEYLSTGFERSRLVVAVTHPDEEMVEPIAYAAAEALLAMQTVEISEQDSSSAVQLPIPQLERSPAYLYPIDRDLIVNEIDLTGDIRRELRRIITNAIVVGLVAVVVLELIDPTIRTRASAEKLKLPIMGEIPAS